MCGLTGFWSFTKNFTEEELTNIATEMSMQLKHRGPDDHGVWIERSHNLSLAHRRLAIMDLTPLGKQPMNSKSNRFVIVYNGEVYNAQEIQQQLIKKGHSFIGHSDTEVILAAFDNWGIELSIKKFIGMFAMVVWDRELKELILIRDRLGVKPLYYGIIDNTFLFGSELKSLFKYPYFKKDIDLKVLASYIKLNYVPTPYSIFKNIYKLEPATILKINELQRIETINYWNLAKIIAVNKNFNTEQVIISDLHDLLQDSIRLRMLSDVPVGALLSGGIDSSLVVALMQANSKIPIKTFTIGFNDQQYNEAAFAKAIAKHLGTFHQELILDSKQALDIIPNLADFYDEPFADSSQIAMALVAKLASKDVTVVLSGDGGDELFAGYNRHYYFLYNYLFVRMNNLPRAVKKLLSFIIKTIFINVKEKLRLNFIFDRLVNSFVKINNLNNKLTQLADLLLANSKIDLYSKVISFWNDKNPMLSSDQLLNPDLVYIRGLDLINQLDNFTEQMQVLDFNNYLVDDILTKVDRATMAYGLEARGPLLDHRIVEFSWQLPMNFKIRGNQQKWILKQILMKYLPDHLIHRHKMGFAVPISRWLKKDLRNWAIDLLDPSKINSQGFFNSKIVNDKLTNHLKGKQDSTYDLWGVLIFQSWYEKYLK